MTARDALRDRLDELENEVTTGETVVNGIEMKPWGCSVVEAGSDIAPTDTPEGHLLITVSGEYTPEALDRRQQ